MHKSQTPLGNNKGGKRTHCQRMDRLLRNPGSENTVTQHRSYNSGSQHKAQLHQPIVFRKIFQAPDRAVTESIPLVATNNVVTQHEMTYGDILTYTTYFLLKLWIYCNFAPLKQ